MKKCILIIEDDEMIRDNLAELLVLEGFNVTTADCGLEALLLAQAQLPDLVMCDVEMPGMGGYEVLISLRQNRFTSHIPFFFSTDNSEKSGAQKAKAFGIENYLVKPFDGSELMSCVTKCLLDYKSPGSKPVILN